MGKPNQTVGLSQLIHSLAGLDVLSSQITIVPAAATIEFSLNDGNVTSKDPRSEEEN